MQFQKLQVLFFLITLSGFLISCEKDNENNNPSYQVPETYDFEHVKYTGQTARILLMDSLNKLVNAARGVQVTEQQLLDVYENTSGLYANLNSGKIVKLSDKAEASADAQVRNWFKLVAQHSGTQPNAKYLITSDNNLDLNQLIQKTLMGAVPYYQATNTYLIEKLPTADNTTIVPEEGTQMEHYWDEAFGYFSAPRDFGVYTEADLTSKSKDTNGDGKIDPVNEKPYYHASYAITRDMISKDFSAADKTEFRKQLMNAFLKGKAAIVNKDMKGRDEAKQEILTTWEKLIAANTMHYFNETRNYILEDKQSDLPNRYHVWAEGRGFLNSLKYNSSRKITDADWNEISGYLGNKPDDATAENLNKGVKKLQSIYGFTDYQSANLRLAAEE